MIARIAVVGAGLFGISVALKLGQNYSVDLYEKENDLLTGASGINQFRLHRGYHYPRSRETVTSSLESQKSFMREYGESVIEGIGNYYCVASKNSLITASDYLSFCNTNDLKISKAKLDLVRKDSIDICLRVKENLIDPKKLRAICVEKLRNSNVNLLLSHKADKRILKKYDFVIICTYANINSLLGKTKQNNYQFELCEKIVVSLPDQFRNKSIVILDGPFMCIDPYGSTGLFLMGNVVHAIHQANIGKYPLINNKYKNLLNKGIIKNPEITNFSEFIRSTKVFIPLISKAKHIGSMFTIRTVLPNKESTDERPTIVREINMKTFTVFSGKLVSCINAADEVSKMIANNNP